jgi:hypothetical protein
MGMMRIFLGETLGYGLGVGEDNLKRSLGSC